MIFQQYTYTCQTITDDRRLSIKLRGYEGHILSVKLTFPPIFVCINTKLALIVLVSGLCFSKKNQNSIFYMIYIHLYVVSLLYVFARINKIFYRLF